VHATFHPTVYIVDDDASVRQAMEWLFGSVGLRTASFATPAEFLQRTSADEVSGCLILDIRMPGVSGLDVQRMLTASGCDIPTIFVSAHADIPLSVQAMKGGAMEVLTKPFDDQVLLDAVYRGIETDRIRYNERLSSQQCVERYATLTNRERQVMERVIQGLLNKQIAAELGTAEKTVKVHRAQVMHKMGARSVADLIQMANRVRLPHVKPHPSNTLRPKVNPPRS